VLTLQRRPDPTLAAEGPLLEQWAVDLADPVPIAGRLETWLAAQATLGPARVTLVNNAALLAEPAPLSHPSSAVVSPALRVGLEAPVLLSGAFLRATAGWSVPRRLMQISSGLGRRAMAGAAVYCAVKAGLDHFSRAVALEEAGQPNGARSVSIAPGIIDTDMQRQLRGADPAVFAARGQFQAFKDQGQLDTPQGCAARLLAYLERADFGSQPVADIRDAG
jgi:NAD(P)-dependent dehydrogenase (short-subunit alcohol dehydrogenase family)